MIRTPEAIKLIVQQLKGERGNWENHWQEIADHMMPRKNDINTSKSPGEKRNYQIVDNTGMQSLELLAGALHGILTNPSQLWFELTTGDDALDNNIVVRTWLEDSAKRMLQTMNNSNFQTEVHEFYLDLCGFGTGSLFVHEENTDLDFIFQCLFIKEIFIRENNKGLVDEVYRVFEWDARKLVQEFGETKKLPEEVFETYKKGSCDKKWEVIHAIYPQDKYAPIKKKGFRFPFVSQYILTEKDIELTLSGYNEKPSIVSRWAKSSGESYGRGPGMTALPEVKMVNVMQDTMIRGAQKVIDPPLQVPDDGFVLPIKTRPGSVNVRRGGTGRGEKITPIFNDARIDFGYEVLRDQRSKIREAFFVDQFQMQQGGPQMTATEVLQRTEEKMRLLGPLLGRQQAEFLRPLIDRVFAIMLRKKRFLPVPEPLRGVNLDVRYSSAIAKAQRVRDAEGILQTVQVLAPFAQIDPTIMDWVNGDNVLKGVSKIYSFPSSFLRSEVEVEQIRAQKQQAAAEAQRVARETQDAQNIGAAGPALAQLQTAQDQAQNTNSEIEE